MSDKSIGVRISFLIQSEFGDVRAYVDSHHGPRCQIVTFGVEKFPGWANGIDKAERIVAILKKAAMTCRFVYDQDNSGTVLPWDQVFIKNLHFKGDFGPNWSVSLRRAGLNPQDCRIEPLSFSRTTEGRALQIWLNQKSR
jgi:hypothetical protein